ncbi:retrotransposon hot spot (RHS) protein, putative, partial [Trypanosoma cruzi]
AWKAQESARGWQCRESSVCCAARRYSDESKAVVPWRHGSTRCDPHKSGGNAANTVDHEQQRKGHPAEGKGTHHQH